MVAFEKPVKVQPLGLDATLALEQSDDDGTLRIQLRARSMLLCADDGRPLTLDGQEGTRYEADWIERGNSHSQAGSGGTMSALDVLVPAIRLVESAENIASPRRLTILVCGGFVPQPTDLEVAGFKWRLSGLHTHSETRSLLKSTQNTAVTVRLECSLTPGQSASDAEKVAEDLLWMIRFADARPNYWCRATLVDDAGRIAWTNYREGAPPSRTSPGPLSFDQPQVTGFKTFLEGSYNSYRAAEGQYRLRGVIDLLRLVRSEFPTEVKALIASNILEMLRHNYGVNILVAAGRAVLDGDDICWRPGQKPRAGTNRMYLSEIIELLCGDLALTGWSTSFKDLRNDVTHKCVVPGATPREQYFNTMDLIHFIDRVVLALLDVDKLALSYFRCNTKSDRGVWVAPFQR